MKNSEDHKCVGTQLTGEESQEELLNKALALMAMLTEEQLVAALNVALGLEDARAS